CPLREGARPHRRKDVAAAARWRVQRADQRHRGRPAEHRRTLGRRHLRRRLPRSLRRRHALDPPRRRRHRLPRRKQALDAERPHRLAHLHPHRAGARDGEGVTLSQWPVRSGSWTLVTIFALSLVCERSSGCRWRSAAPGNSVESLLRSRPGLGYCAARRAMRSAAAAGGLWALALAASAKAALAWAASPSFSKQRPVMAEMKGSRRVSCWKSASAVLKSPP